MQQHDTGESGGDGAATGINWRRILRALRLLFLVAVLITAAFLNAWSHQGDPRFYAFLSSPTGQTVARLFGWWRSPLERPSPVKPDRLMTEVERTTKLEIETALHLGLEVTGDMAARYYAPDITYRDVAFRSEFPTFRLEVRPPFAILTDASTTDVDTIVDLMQQTHTQFLDTFRPLFTQAYRKELIHLLYFAEPEDYLAYQQEHAREMKHTSGFYSPTVNRLVLYRQHLGALASAHESFAGDQTLCTFRHEAVHQFMFAHGVHSAHRIENEWLIEGLASYCESATFGAVEPSQMGLLQVAAENDRLYPLRELVNHRSDTGLLGYKAAELAYSESWSLVHFLMQPENRYAFFQYVQYVRDPAHFREVNRRERFDLLAEFFEITPLELTRRWQRHLASL
jgi:hypothetical protein